MTDAVMIARETEDAFVLHPISGKKGSLIVCGANLGQRAVWLLEISDPNIAIAASMVRCTNTEVLNKYDEHHSTTHQLSQR